MTSEQNRNQLPSMALSAKIGHRRIDGWAESGIGMRCLTITPITPLPNHEAIQNCGTRRLRSINDVDFSASQLPYLRGIVDNPLIEARLHGLNQGDEIVFQEAHILTVHDVHRMELVAAMDAAALKELTQWLSRIARD